MPSTILFESLIGGVVSITSGIMIFYFSKLSGKLDKFTESIATIKVKTEYHDGDIDELKEGQKELYKIVRKIERRVDSLPCLSTECVKN